MSISLVVDMNELQQPTTQKVSSSTQPSPQMDMSPATIKIAIVTFSLTALYLAISSAWLWSAMYRYQNCL
jgi:hypothetical protein